MNTTLLTSRHYLAIFLVALVTIATQILISRIFSVTLYYHFAFAGITFAMLGLTSGAIRVYQRPEYFSAERVDFVLAEYGTRFALYLSLAVLFHAWLPGIALAWRNDSAIAVINALPAFFMVGSLILLLYAFFESGICIALLLTRFPASTGRLYAFDLAGAALGCIVVIIALRMVDPISALLVLATALAWMGRRFLPDDATTKLRRLVKSTVIGLTLVSALQLVTYANGTPVMRLTWAKTAMITEPPLFEKWNTYSRIAIRELDTKEPFGWGFGIKHTQEIDQKYLNIDADAGTILTRFDGDLSKVKYLQDDIINLGYHIRSPKDVAVIGIGGGRDILSALTAGAKHIQGIELNPATVQALTQVFGDFTGHLDRRPEVSFATAEARSYLTSHTNSYDLIQISLIDTWAATAAGGLTLSENKLYTTAAWNEFFDRLNDKGMLVISRWYEPKLHQGEFYRMLAIASDVMKSRDPAGNPRLHMLAAHVTPEEWTNGIIALVLSKSPFTKEEIAKFKATCNRLNFKPLLSPGMTVDDTVARLSSGTADKAFFDSLELDVSPSTDDRPFFFHMLRMKNILSGHTAEATAATMNYKNNQGVYTLLLIFVITFIASLAFIVWPLVKLYGQHRVKLTEAFPFMLYFGGIGLGFMLIEISQMQRLMIFLGHPVYGLSVVLFTLLLASSLGSYLQRNVRPDHRHLWLMPATLCVVLGIIGLLTPQITEHLKYYDTTVRILATGLVTAAMGLFMGMMFPVGVALASVRHERLLPWYWGINGAASVFASVFAVVLSLQYGISFTFWAGVACYGVCLLVLLFRKQ